MMSQTAETSGSRTTPEDTPPLVTIWEEYGSGAEQIGRAVAERLGLPFHQQAFSSEEIEGGEAPPPDDGSTAQNIASRISLAQVFSAMGGAYAGGDGAEYLAADRERRALIDDNNATVHGFGKEGGVILGRNATKILAHRPRTLHVLLTADAETRVDQAAQSSGISREQAQDRQKREDTVRTDMSQQLYGWDPRDPANYDLMLNTGRIPHEAAVEAIVHAVQHATS